MRRRKRRWWMQSKKNTELRIEIYWKREGEGEKLK
jgi:hypothetical protein